MSNELQFYGNPASDTGLTIVARVYDYNGVQVGGDIPTTEVGSEAIYLGDMPAAVAGRYVVRFVLGVDVVGQYQLTWDGTQEITLLDLAQRSAQEIFSTEVESGESFMESQRLQRANAAGSIIQQEDGSYVILSSDGATNRITGSRGQNNGRNISATDAS